MLNNDFLAEDMLIRPNFLGVNLRKCLIFFMTTSGLIILSRKKHSFLC